MALHARIAREAPKDSPVPPTEPNLLAGALGSHPLLYCGPRMFIILCHEDVARVWKTLTTILVVICGPSWRTPRDRN